MLRRLLFFSTIGSLLVLGFFLPKWSGPKNCINSSLVEEISIEGSEQLIGSCNLKTKSLTETPPEWVRSADVLNRIESIEFMATYWNYPDAKLIVHLTPQDEIYVNYREGILFVGSVALNKPGVLEKALMTYWIGLKDPVAAQATVDFLWRSHVMGELETKKEFWLKHLVSLQSYCGLRLNTLHHEDFCSIQRELGEGLVMFENDEGSVHWSLHNVFSKIISEVFMKLPLKKKRDFVQRLIFLNKIEEPYPWANISSVKSLGELDLTFWSQVQHIFSAMDVDYQTLWSAAWKFLPSRSRESFHYTVVDPSLVWSLPVSLHSKNNFVEHRSAKYLYPSDTPLRFSRNELLRSTKINGISIVACETPEPRRLLEFEKYTNRVLFLRICDEAGEELSEILSMTPPNYLKANRKVEFIEFNLSALKLALNIKGKLQSSNELRDWSRWLEWKDFVYDRDRSAYRPRAVYDGIGWFRSAN